ncbi:MAG: hypothetical protein E6J40_11015 [Chloroflexi bacterium]|nr:MAG: hypothetical protein E6J40_11015 [Chloroflexota bacterium]
MVSTAAQADATVLVASSCQKVGSAMPISRKWSRVIDPAQDGGRALLTGQENGDRGHQKKDANCRMAPAAPVKGGHQIAARLASLT